MSISVTTANPTQTLVLTPQSAYCVPICVAVAKELCIAPMEKHSLLLWMCELSNVHKQVGLQVYSNSYWAENLALSRNFREFVTVPIIRTSPPINLLSRAVRTSPATLQGVFCMLLHPRVSHKMASWFCKMMAAKGQMVNGVLWHKCLMD